MRKCTRGVVLCLLVWAGVATAQNMQPAARATICEQLAISERDRVQWEAVQMWSVPTMPFREQVRRHAIHIDVAQPLTLPKLRREWLRPSEESMKEKTDEGAAAETSILISPKRSK